MKRRYTLLPVAALGLVVDAFEHGTTKHGEGDYGAPGRADREFLDKALRHIEAYRAGELLDPETGIPHLGKATANLMILLERQHGSQQETAGPAEPPVECLGEVPGNGADGRSADWYDPQCSFCFPF